MPSLIELTLPMSYYFTLFSCCFLLILDVEDANVHLAAHFLCVFIAACTEHFGHFGIFQSPVQFYNRPEEVLVLLDKFLPNGQLMYLRGNLVKVYLEEAQSVLQMKSLIKKNKMGVS